MMRERRVLRYTLECWHEERDLKKVTVFRENAGCERTQPKQLDPLLWNDPTIAREIIMRDTIAVILADRSASSTLPTANLSVTSAEAIQTRIFTTVKI